MSGRRAAPKRSARTPAEAGTRAPLPRAGTRGTGGTRKLRKEHRPRIVTLGADTTAIALVVVLMLVGVVLVATSVGGDSGRQRETVVNAGSRGSEELAVDAATRVLGAWSQPARGYRDWWDALSPMLTPGGRQAYAYTDPQKVPVLGDLATSDVRMSAAGTTATVYFETSAGRYGVDLSWKSSAGEWLANRVVFPGRESMFG
ncbi:hypothetical protein [Nocardioides sp. R-C-SC26]|uniref:hypothetical protein n=1 Tax=Nocardioides sp. R-C-SC26 TaxID=2870414 RepID=UPI001E3B5192|nr:hypothetical protein [Nocardioides sp. R-C-SC26]